MSDEIGKRLLQLMMDVNAASPADLVAVDKKLRESRLGNGATFFISFCVGALIAEFGAEETDRLFLILIAALAKQQKELNHG